MKFNTADYIIIIGSIILILIILGIIITNNPRNIEHQIETSSANTEFKPTYFSLYDKSTAEVCDRLIIVQPFQWHIWANNGEVLLLNESHKTCPINYTPVILTPHNNDADITKQVFSDVCINRSFNSVVTSYTDSIQAKIIPFEIAELQAKPSKFTILDALNFLFTKYITMDPILIPNPENIYKDRILLGRLHTNKLITSYSVNTPHTNSLLNYQLQQLMQKKLIKDAKQ